MSSEKKQIKIAVSDKIATNLNKDEVLVCGNNDYEVVFEFDKAWDAYNAKTAMFVFGNHCVKKPFDGNVCEGVAVEDATLCAIGVFAGDLITTTGAIINCRPSIRDKCKKGFTPPTKNEYDEIMDLLNRYINASSGAPKGGLAGQVLKKISDKDFDYGWFDDLVRDLTDYYTKTETRDLADERIKALAVLLDPESGSQSVKGDLSIEGTTTVGNLLSNNPFILLNMGDSSPSRQMGIVFPIGDVYMWEDHSPNAINGIGIIYDPDKKNIRIGEGWLEMTKDYGGDMIPSVFIFGDYADDNTQYSEDQAIATRADGITGGNIPKWDAERNMFVDSGYSAFDLAMQISDVGSRVTEVESQIGNISSALDELHAYAQALVGGTTA